MENRFNFSIQYLHESILSLTPFDSSGHRTTAGISKRAAEKQKNTQKNFPESRNRTRGVFARDLFSLSLCHSLFPYACATHTHHNMAMRSALAMRSLAARPVLTPVSWAARWKGSAGRGEEAAGKGDAAKAEPAETEKPKSPPAPVELPVTFEVREVFARVMCCTHAGSMCCFAECEQKKSRYKTRVCSACLQAVSSTQQRVSTPLELRVRATAGCILPLQRCFAPPLFRWR